MKQIEIPFTVTQILEIQNALLIQERYHFNKGQKFSAEKARKNFGMMEVYLVMLEAK